MTHDAMWTAIAVHATATRAGLDPWRARLVAEVVRATDPAAPPAREPDPHEPAAATPVYVAAGKAEATCRMIAQARGVDLRVKAAGRTDDGQEWATFADHAGRVTTVRVDAAGYADALPRLAAFVRGT